MLNKFREATHQLHKDIESENLAELIMQHNITLEEYKKLLLQNYIAYYVTERAIQQQLPTYTSDKSENLAKDLAQLGVKIENSNKFIQQYQLNSPAEAWGAWYVVEGSSLGGMMIAKNIKECDELAAIENHHFFNGKRQSVDGWRQFTKDLKHQEFSKSEENEAIQKAKDTFIFFGNVFKEV
ncbi:biliverdin-producing heme oxygenase [Mesonia aestuariivivens]|uniref:Biliverdin-producing heme oxygenase n=1 Tax=Mesonia aestuariivivens TaxID=2796128 RepID=A0ABS6W3Q3_9FLAO|nr:biliverdin-producing heme oxygenase [Mesonia aestuariivivens]MBW2961753.1 biliverdin-producing heme oxygenase [Mesonia aestuariivivens]